MNKHKNFQDHEKKVRLSTLVYSLLVFSVFIIGIASILAYGTETAIGKKIASSISKVVPYPAAIIGYSHFVYMSDVEKNLASVKNFYQTQDLSKEGIRIDFTTSDGRKRLQIKEKEILDKLVEDKIIEILAKQNGISISAADVDRTVTQKLNEFGTTSDVEKSLMDLYGWGLDDFKQEVVLPGMYQEALAQYVAGQDSDNSKAKEKIIEAQKKLEAGSDFSQIVQQYSEGSSKESNGMLGWVSKDQVMSELQEPLFGASPVAKNSIIESSIGFHIINVENKKKENGKDVLQLRQIFVSKNTFTDWLQEKKKQMRVIVPLSWFKWDSSAGAVDFRRAEMRTFEMEQRIKAQGDASIIF